MVGMRQSKVAVVAVLLAGIFLVATDHAQSQATEAEIFARLQGKPLYLIGLWGEDNLKFDAQGHPAASYATASFTVCGMQVAKVSLNGNQLKLEGTREGIEFDKHGAMIGWAALTGDSHGFKAPKPEKISIEIDNGNSSDFSPALDAIFAEDLNEIVPLLPDLWELYFRTHRDQQGSGTQSQPLPSAIPNNDATHIGGSVRPPKLLHSVEPEFTDYARRNRISGNVQLYLWVNEDGTPSHIRIMRPLGLGLDEKAVAALKQFRFAPATQNGKPVKVDLYIDMNFQLF